MEDAIKAKEIGYMFYNKLNMIIATLLIGFSIVFAIFGDRVNISGFNRNDIGYAITGLLALVGIYKLSNLFYSK